MATELVRSPQRLLLAVTVLAAAAALFTFGYVQSASQFRESEGYVQQVETCRSRTLNTLRDAPIDLDLLRQIPVLCYNDVRRTQLLSGSAVTRGDYIHQRFENNVILAMVVTITLAGLALAGVQLLTSYKLAVLSGGTAATDSELAVAQGKLSIRSSVTGIIVLGLSLVFFIVFVLYVYTLKQDKIETVVEVDGAPVMTTAQTPQPTTQPATQLTTPPVSQLGSEAGLRTAPSTGEPMLLSGGGFGSPTRSRSSPPRAHLHLTP